MEKIITCKKNNDLIYDVGLHRGEDTDFYLKKGFRVIAFEANPELVSYCKQRFATHLEAGKLIIIEGAIVDPKDLSIGQKKIRFYKNDSLSVWGTVCSEWAERNDHRGTSSTVVEVEVIDFVRILEEYGIPHYMKIDIEGCDIVCINALKQFKEVPNYISLESSKTSFSAIKAEIESLSELGYQIFQAVEQSSIPRTQLPPYPAKEGTYSKHMFEEGSSGLFGAELPNHWKSKKEIIQQYRTIWLGYALLGDFGTMKDWKFPGAYLLRGITRQMLKKVNGAPVPGWYDTHAALSPQHARRETKMR